MSRYWCWWFLRMHNSFQPIRAADSCNVTGCKRPPALLSIWKRQYKHRQRTSDQRKDELSTSCRLTFKRRSHKRRLHKQILHKRKQRDICGLGESFIVFPVYRPFTIVLYFYIGMLWRARVILYTPFTTVGYFILACGGWGWYSDKTWSPLR